MKKSDPIAILGWGSLVWDPGTLSTAGEWTSGGPVLPIEFSRRSDNGRLTLVIDETNGVDVPTRFVLSGLPTLAEAIQNLQMRENAPTAKGIGFIDLIEGKESPQARRNHPRSTDFISSWAKENGFSAVLWTGIGPRFEDGFSPAAALNYLRGLEDSKRALAFEYIRKAPADVVTPVRTLFDAEFGRHEPL